MTAGLEKRTSKNKIFDPEINELSIQKKQLRLRYENETNYVQVRVLKAQFNQLSHQIRDKIKAKNEKRLNSILDEIKQAQNSCKMFKAVKLLNRKPLQNSFIYDKDKKKVTDPNEIHNIVKEHFQTHFYKPELNAIQPDTFIEPLQFPITSDEVNKASIKMSNGKQPGDDNTSVKQINMPQTQSKTKLLPYLIIMYSTVGILKLEKDFWSHCRKSKKRNSQQPLPNHSAQSHSQNIIHHLTYLHQTTDQLISITFTISTPQQPQYSRHCLVTQMDDCKNTKIQRYETLYCWN